MDTLFAIEIHRQENVNIPVGIMFEEVCLVLSIVFELTLRMDQFMEAMQIHSSRRGNQRINDLFRNKF